MFGPSKKDLEEKVQKDKETADLKYCEDFASRGDYVEYLGIKMIVCKHHRICLSYPKSYILPGIWCEWRTKNDQITDKFFTKDELNLLKRI